MKIISFINMKGGVGKTTSVVEIATILATEHDKRVLIIDIDPQTNATFAFIKYKKWEKEIKNNTIADVLGMNQNLTSREKEYDINKAIVENVSGINNLDLISSHLELTFLDLDLSSKPGREKILSRQIKGIKKDYDFIIIDCPPNLTLAPQNALVISDYIITPIIPDFYSFLGLPLLINRVDKLKRELDMHVTFLGAIFTRVEANTKLHKKFTPKIREVCEHYKIYDFASVIPKNIDLSSAPSSSTPATLKFPKANGVKAYKILVKEILLELSGD